MSCNNCNQTPCGCGQRPTYQSCCKTKTVCPDSVVTVNHGDITLSGGVGPVMTAERSFSIPACNEQSVISVYGEVATPPSGAQVYISRDGLAAFLTVISTTRYYEGSDQSSCNSSCGSSTGSANESDEAYRTELTVLNQCLSCTTLSVGTFLEQGTSLIFAAPDCSVTSTGSSDLVLCDKLHVPEVGETETVEVSPSTSGLEIGDVIQITDKKFQINSIPTSTSVELLNSGEGGDPGTIIDGSDCSSVRIYVIAGDNPCEKTPVAEADAVLVCDGGLETILDLEDGQVVGQVNGKVVGVDLPEDDTVCSEITCCLNLTTGVTTYSVTVEDATGFAVDDLGYFTCDSDTDRRYKITAIVGTTLTLEAEFTPTANEQIGSSTTTCRFCLVNCCETLRAELEELIIDTVDSTDTCAAGGIGATYAVRSASIAGQTLTINGAPEHKSISIFGNGSGANWNLTDAGDQDEVILEQEIVNDTCREMNVFVSPICNVQAVANTAEQIIRLTTAFDTGNGNIGSASSATFRCPADGEMHFLTVTVPRTTVVPPNTTVTIRTRLRVIKVNAAGNFNSSGNHLSGSMRGIAVTGNVV